MTSIQVPDEPVMALPRRGAAIRTWRSAPEQQQAPRRRRSKGWGVIAAFSVLTLGAGAAAGANLYYHHAEAAYESSVQRFDEPVFPAEHGPAVAGAGEHWEHPRPESLEGSVTVLIVGTDGSGDPGLFSSDDDDAERSDAVMLANVSDDRAEVYSIPRDLWVEAPGGRQLKLSQAYSLDGMASLVPTVEQLTGVRIDHAVEADLAGFASVVDALGGVTVELGEGEGFTARDGTVFSEGPNELDSEAAEAFVRERYAFPDSDLRRMENQQLFLQAVAEQVEITDLAQAVELIEEVGVHLTVSEDLDMRTAGLLALRGRDAEFFTLEHSGTGREAGQDVLYPLEDYDEVLGPWAEDDG